MGEEHKYYVKDYSEIPIGDEGDLENLRGISNMTISELCEKRSGDKIQNLLIFPRELNAYKDDIDKYEICRISDNKLFSSDILGFVGSGETELTIYSRFTEQKKIKDSKGDAEVCGEDFFLHYMVQRVFNINMFDLKHSPSEDRVFDFLLCLFPKYLKDALRQGLYKQYVVNKYNDSNVRGMIDVARHIKNNVPFVGKIAYNVREYSYDNSITQLIRHTIECIRSSRMSGILKQDDDTENYVSQICAATPSYKSQDRSRIVSKNLKAPTSPYYLGYIPLQKLCIQILTHKKLKYGNANDKQIYGLLFVGSWLWEEYLAGILRNCGFTHAENKTGKNPIHLFNPNSYARYPDFYKYKRDRYDADYVLDAKYKHLEGNNEIGRDDIHQVITYMHVQKAPKGGVVYPYEKRNKDDKIENSIEEKLVGKLRGQEEWDINKIGVPIPCYTIKNYNEFQNEMKNIETALIKTLG